MNTSEYCPVFVRCTYQFRPDHPHRIVSYNEQKLKILNEPNRNRALSNRQMIRAQKSKKQDKICGYLKCILSKWSSLRINNSINQEQINKAKYSFVFTLARAWMNLWHLFSSNIYTVANSPLCDHFKQSLWHIGTKHFQYNRFVPRDEAKNYMRKL